MRKLWGTALIFFADVLLVRYLTERKKTAVQCLWEITGFLADVTYDVTQWKQTLEQAIADEKHQGFFPGIFREKFAKHRKTLPLRDALQKSLEALPLPKDASTLCARYFSVLGRVTDKSAEESFLHTKLRLEEILNQLQAQLPQKQKLIRAGVYSASALATVLLL